MPSLRRKRAAAGLLLSAALACTPKDTPVKNPPAKLPPTDAGKTNPQTPPTETPPIVNRDQPGALVKVLTEDTQTTTTSGASFLAPKGWTLALKNGVYTLTAPEKDISLVFAERSEKDFASAAAALWKEYKPSFASAVKNTTNAPASSGWDEIVQLEYNTPAKENRVELAVGRRKGATWYVHLIDGSNAGLDRRGAQLGAALSVKAPGVEEESYAGRTPKAFEGELVKQFEGYLLDKMEKTKVPGVAIAVVQNGKIIYEQGFGVRALGSKDKVTPNTLFMIGSTTKPLTSLMIASLVDEGKFSWETPLTELYPSFALADPTVTKQLAVKHTVCACTGLPRQDFEFIFEYAKSSPEARLASMKEMKPTTGFGETFQYSNTLVAAGGYIAAHAAAPKKSLTEAYEATVKARVFDPLGMKSTVSSEAAAKKFKDRASPHALNIDNTYSLMPNSYEGAVYAVSPAGAAWSTVGDLGRYILFELNKGKTADGKQLISEATLMKRREPQVAVNDTDSYGLGLFLEKEKGLQVIGHNGNTLGFSSTMAFLPEQGIGLVILTNGRATNFFMSTVQRRFFELLFDGKAEAEDRFSFNFKTQNEQLAKELAKLEPSIDPAWLKPFFGKYSTPGLGTLELRQEKAGPVIDAGEWKSTFRLQKEEDGTNSLILDGAPVAGLPFTAEMKDGAPQLVLSAGQFQYTFTQAPKK